MGLWDWGTHPDSWHDAKDAADDAERRYREAVSRYGDSEKDKWRIDQARSAMETAQSNFRNAPRD